MPDEPKASSPAGGAGDDPILPLQEWMRLITGQGASMRSAMALAAKAYKDYNTRAKLALLTLDEVNTIIPEKEGRKAVWNAIKGVQSGQSPQKKRRRDDDLLRPLGGDTKEVPESFEFHEVRDPEALLDVSVTVNRAPVKTAWAYAVARRLGFDVEESLSLAHVYVHIGSLKHALALGNILNAQETRDAEDEIRELPGESGYTIPGTGNTNASAYGKRKRAYEVEERKVGSSQPWVGLLRSNPVIERPDGTWRAIQKGVPIEPSVGYLYITRALKTNAPHVMGAMQLVAESYSPEELDTVGLALYNEFKPDVVNWGQRGTLSVAAILDQIKEPIRDDADADADAGENGNGSEEVKEVKEQAATTDEDKDGKPSDAPDPAASASAEEDVQATPSRKAKTDAAAAEAMGMSLEEYQAMLSAEFDASLDDF